MYIPLTGDISHHIKTLRGELMDDPHLINSSFVSELPIDPLGGTAGVVWEGKSPDAWPMFSAMGVDENFLNVFQVRLLAGRWFSPAFGFVDQDLARKYETEQRMGILFNYSACLAIFISCLGLTGLAAFMSERRTKEIGIRKTLGVNVTRIASMLSRDLLRLVLISIIIASPIAYYLMTHWLRGFAYRVNIHWWVFALAGFAAVFISLITVGFQAVKAAVANPVNSLRAE